MKVDALKQRLNRDRPMATITIRMPEDVIEDLKRLAPVLGFLGISPWHVPVLGKGYVLTLSD